MLIPAFDCPLCPRLAAFREENKRQYPSFFNGPVPSFGALDAEFLVVGLAPGLKGANQTGRPFTGDYAGIILYGALLKAGFARGEYAPHLHLPPHAGGGRQGGDSLQLINCRITNAVRCVPQENKPETSEIKNCNAFLAAEIAAMPNLKLILSLGLVSHNAVLKATGHKASYAKFAHGAIHTLICQSPKPKAQSPILLNSYHTSRYNINVGTLTVKMFDAIMEKAKTALR